MTSDEYSEKRDLNIGSIWKDNGPVLDHLDIELTERCNNNCIHCCINLLENDLYVKSRELSTDEWKGILKQAADSGVLTVRFTGGEPLLRGDFEELYTYARQLGMRVLIFTNARLITSRLSDLFARIPPCERIEITVYGMCKDSYEAVSRVPGSFKEFWEGVNSLLDKKVPFIVKGILLPQNKSDIQSFEEWVRTIPWMDSTPSYAMFFELRCRRDSEKKNERICGLRVSPEAGLKHLTRDANRFRKEMAQFCSKFMRPSGDRLFGCGAGHGACVDAYGMVQPCLPLRTPELCYNIRRGSLREALTIVFPQIWEMKAQNPEYLKRCSRCFLKGLCEQCPAKSWSEHGTLDTPVEYLCKVAHAQARYLGLLIEDENAWEVEDASERVRRLQSINRTIS